MIYPVLTRIKKIKRQPDISFIYIQDGESIKKHPLNETAVSILELCGGRNSVPEIVKILSKKYSENVEKVEKLVSDFLEYSRQLGVLILENERREKENPMEILGSDNQWLPDSVIFELTYDCPLNCKHCYLDSRKPVYMDYIAIIRICEELRDIGIDAVQLTGGEPLIYPKIKELIDYLCDNGFITAVTTSGFISKTKLNGFSTSFKKMAKTNGIIQVSLDGFETNHNHIRGNYRSFKRAVNFIEIAVEQKVQTHVATVVTENSYEELTDFSRFLKSKGVSVHRIGFMMERGRAKHNNYIAAVEYVEMLKKKIIELKQSLEDDNFKILELDEVKEHQNYLFYKNCGAGSRFYRISPDFKLYPCIFIDSPIGDLNVHSIFELFQESPKKYTKIPAPNRELCGNCRLLVKCEGCFAEGMINKDKVKTCLWYNDTMSVKNEKK